MKRLALFVTVLLISIGSLCAKTWFVCAGSFSKFENAEERCAILNDAGYDCFVEVVERTGGTKLYRVLFFDDILLRDEARARKDELLNVDVIKKNGWTDLWICEAEQPSASNVYKTKNKVSTPETISESDLTSTIEKIEVVPETASDSVKINGISDSIMKCLKAFPTNADYLMNDFSLYDFADNSGIVNQIFGENENIENGGYSEIAAGAYASYENISNGKEIEVTVYESEKGFSNAYLREEILSYWDDEDFVKETVLKTNYGKLKTCILQDEDCFYIYGISADKKMAVYITAYDFTDEEVQSFLKNAYNSETSLYIKTIIQILEEEVSSLD